jgi:hypothetical protein
MFGIKGGAFVMGGKHKKSSSLKRRLKGGSKLLTLNAYPLSEGVNTLGTSSAPGADNYNFKPEGGWFSDQVGGSYGYDAASAAADVPSFAGSYIPVSRACTGNAPDNNARGGNNFTQAGGRRRRRGKKARKSKRTAKKWWQRGCSSSGGAKTKKKGKRSRRRNMKGGLVGIIA